MTMELRKKILNDAEKIVNGEREGQYGSPEDNFQKIADMWTAYLGFPVDPKDVAAMMIMLKVARIGSGMGSLDCWEDIAGYAACGGAIFLRQDETI